MQASIVLLLAVSAFLLLGYGKKTLYELRFRTGAAMILILITLILIILPDYGTDTVKFDIGGLWLILIAVWLLVRRGRVIDKFYNIISVLTVAGMVLLYRYMAVNLTETVYGEILYVSLITLAAYLLSKGALGSFISSVIGVALGTILLGVIPWYNVSPIVIGANPDIMIISAIACLLVHNLTDYIGMISNRNKRYDSQFEASDEFMDEDDV